MAKGRHKGSPNITEIQQVEASRCSRCGSTEREEYSNTRALRVGGVTSQGEAYTHIVFRNTKCRNPECRQARVDRTFENRIGEDEPV